MENNFFKTNKNISEIDNQFSSFRQDFSENQKKAVMFSLFFIAASDGDTNDKELNYLSEISFVLGYKINSFEGFLNDIRTMGRDDIFYHLNTLLDSLKDWYIFTALGMVYADEKVTETELNYYYKFLSKMEISDERCERVIKEHQLLIENFKDK